MPERVAIHSYTVGEYDYVTMWAWPEEDQFWINMGGSDYYAHQEGLTREEAARLRGMLDDWLVSDADE